MENNENGQMGYYSNEQEGNNPNEYSKYPTDNQIQQSMDEQMLTGEYYDTSHGYGENEYYYESDSTQYEYEDYRVYESSYNDDGYERRKGSLGMTSMIIGIVALAFDLFCCCSGSSMWIFMSVPGIVALILAIVSKKRREENSGVSTAGMVLSILALLFGLIGLTVVLFSFGSLILGSPVQNGLLNSLLKELYNL